MTESKTPAASWLVPLITWIALLALAGLPSAARLPGAHPPQWAALLVLGGLVHAATLALGVLALSAVVNRTAGTIVGVALVTYVAIDSQLYLLMGMHFHRTALRTLVQPGSLATLGLSGRELGLAALLLGVLAVVAVWVNRRAGYAAPGRWLLVFLALDAGVAVGGTLARFYGVQPLIGLSEAMPLAWAPRDDALLSRLTGRDPQALESDILFPANGFEKLGRSFEAQAGPATPTRRPDVLLVVVESLRGDELARMQRVRGLAERSVWSAQHHAAGNCTLTGTFSLYSGLAPTFMTTEQTWRSPLGLQAFVDLGYDVSVTHSASLNHDLIDLVLEKGRAHVVGEAGTVPAKLDEDNTALIIDWVKAGPRPRPAFAVLFLDSSHWPYDLGEGVQPFALEDSWLLRHEVPRLHERYSTLVQRQDERIGRVLDAVEAAGREDLVIIVTGDHGEAFGEHGVLMHGSRLDEEQLRVPLVMHLPGVEPRALTERSVHQDVLPTLLGYLGVPRQVPGGGIDLLAGRPRSGPPVVGCCGFGEPVGYSALMGERRALFGLTKQGVELVDLVTAGGAWLDPNADPELRVTLEHIQRDLWLATKPLTSSASAAPAPPAPQAPAPR